MARNIARLEFRRNLARKKRFNILMRSWNTKTNTPIEVSIPRDASVEWSRQTGIEKAVQKIQSLDANGAQITKDAPAFLFPYQRRTRDQLITLGENIFEEIVRQQLEGSFETHEMSIDDSKGVEFDLTQIKIGTPCFIGDNTGRHTIYFKENSRRATYIRWQKNCLFDKKRIQQTHSRDTN